MASLIGAGMDEAMSDYRLRYMDPKGKFIRADLIESACDPDAVDIAYERRLPVRSELWRENRLVAKLPPNRQSRPIFFTSPAHRD